MTFFVKQTIVYPWFSVIVFSVFYSSSVSTMSLKKVDFCGEYQLYV